MNKLLCEELILYIFLFLPEMDLIYIRGVCKYWNRLAKDQTLLYAKQELNKGQHPSNVFVGCCQNNSILSFEWMIDFIMENVITLQILIKNLWCVGFVQAAKNNNIYILRRLISFGVNEYYNDALLLSCQHLQVIEILLKEFQYDQYTIDKAIDIATIYGNEVIIATLKDYREVIMKKYLLLLLKP